MKAYTTRVGEGPFPTEDAVLSDLLHSMGREFAVVAGRARRCGWFDAVATRYAAPLNGINELAVTNLDGLDSLERVKICVAYRLDGKRLAYPPTCAAALGRAQPAYIEMPGWEQSTRRSPILRRLASERPTLFGEDLRTDRRQTHAGRYRPQPRPDDLGLIGVG